MTQHVTVLGWDVFLQGAASFVGAVLTGDSIQWYCGNAQSLSETTADALTDAEHWLGANICALRCNLPLHAEVQYF